MSPAAWNYTGTGSGEIVTHFLPHTLTSLSNVHDCRCPLLPGTTLAQGRVRLCSPSSRRQSGAATSRAPQRWALDVVLLMLISPGVSCLLASYKGAGWGLQVWRCAEAARALLTAVHAWLQAAVGRCFVAALSLAQQLATTHTRNAIKHTGACASQGVDHPHPAQVAPRAVGSVPLHPLPARLHSTRQSRHQGLCMCGWV